MAFGMTPRAGRVVSGWLTVLSVAAFAICLYLTAMAPKAAQTLETCADDELRAHPELAEPKDSDRQGVLRLVVPDKSEHWLGDGICVIVAGVSLAHLQLGEDEARAKTKLEEADASVAAAETTLIAANRKLAEAAGADIAVQQAAVEKAQQAVKTEKGAREAAETAYRQAHAKAIAPAETVELTPFLNNVKADWAKLKVKAVETPQAVLFDFGSPTDSRDAAAKFWQSALGGSRDRVAGTASFVLAAARTNADVAEQTDSANLVAYRIYLMKPLLAGAAGILLLAAAIVVLASDSTLLRDNSRVRADNPDVVDGPWSLGRVQMAIWMLLVFAAFLFFWLVLRQYNNIITPGLLVLLGINSTTGLLSDAVDKNDNSRCKGFFSDLLMTEEGPQLHRIQIMIWTILLALVFIWNVIYSFTVVNFDTNLLLLMGIAQSTYLGFKTQEKPK